MGPDDNEFQQDLDQAGHGAGQRSEEKAAEERGQIGNLEFHIGRCKGQGHFDGHEQKGQGAQERDEDHGPGSERTVQGTFLLSNQE